MFYLWLLLSFYYGNFHIANNLEEQGEVGRVLSTEVLKVDIIVKKIE